MQYDLKWFRAVSLAFLAGYCFQSAARSEILTMAALSDGSHVYYHELITKSMEEIGYDVEIQVKPNLPLPQKRIVLLLENGKLTLHWMVQSDERDKSYVPVRVDITNGLAGHRILFIPKGSQSVYDSVKNLDDFRNLGKIDGLGKNWFDAKVWRKNRLRHYEQDGEWRCLYKKIPLSPECRSVRPAP
ncbi:MAG: hypothetical protein GY765_27505, partial [bacterium]|nr:hypothetical protein [bacterium]